MNVQLLERPLDGGATALPPELGTNAFAAPFGYGAPLGPTPGDGISRIVPPGLGTSDALGPLGGLLGVLSGTAFLSPLGGLLQQIGTLLQQMFGATQGGTNGTGGSPFGSEQYFANASGGSVGDPHLTFNGQHWDDMHSQSDLLHSDSIPGGYQLSTVVTPPNAQGVTYNAQASVTTAGGATSVSLDKSGAAAIVQNGTSFAVQPGTSYDLGNGEFVSRDAGGALTVTCTNGAGGQITTTMRSNGTGVDVSTSGNNVDLGGALLDGGGTHVAPPGPIPVPTPTPGPTPPLRIPRPIRYEGA